MMLRVASRICNVSLAIGVIAIGLIALFTFLEIVSRSLLGRPIPWVADMSSYALCLGISLSVPFVTRNGLQIAVTLLLEALRGHGARALQRATEALAGAACLVIAAICVHVAVAQFGSGVTTVATVPAPKWVLTGLVAYGFLLGGIMHLLNATYGYASAPFDAQVVE